MPSIGYIVRRVAQLGPRETARRVSAALSRRRRAARIRAQDLTHSTFAAEWPQGELAGYFPAIEGLATPEWLLPVCEHALAHEFDLLGSGWTHVRYGMKARGLEGHGYRAASAAADAESLTARQVAPNRAECARVRGLVSAEYEPIDWHLDFKSGHRWPEAFWHLDITYGDQLGVDVKVPWELARAQHLPLLAWAANADPALAQRHAIEFRDQVLDFIAANPPRFGVNWTCAMDVGIRAANWLVAYDLFCADGHVFDEEFERVFTRSIYEHGRHIVGNLEWSAELRGNHYLADIAGLLFCSAYLPRSRETDAWLAFTARELLAEVPSQFWPDGASFEGSTAYHRLSSELAIYGLALLTALPEERRMAFAAYDHTAIEVPVPLSPAPLRVYPLADEVLARMHGAGDFARDVIRPDGRIVQIGDNDSGRLFKFGASYQTAANGDWAEEHLDFRSLVGAFAGLLGRRDLLEEAGDARVEYEVLRALSGRAPWEPVGGGAASDAGPAVGEPASGAARQPGPGAVVAEFAAPGGAGLAAGIEAIAYPDFGFYLLRSARLWLCVRCGSVGQNGNGGHAHNDQLSVELWIDGRPVLVDPGTYLYTPLPARRNEYRSVAAHAAPQAADGREPGSLEDTLFRLIDTAHARCEHFDASGFLGSHAGFGVRVWRLVEVLDDRVRITDWPEDPRLELAPMRDPLPFSAGYGLVERGR